MLRWGPAGWRPRAWSWALKSDSKLSGKSEWYSVREQAVKPVERLKLWHMCEASRGRRTRKPNL